MPNRILCSLIALSLATFSTMVEGQQADSRASYRPSDQTEASRGGALARSAEVYKAIIKDGKVPPSLLQDSKCIAVFPGVITAALGVGGTHGNGIGFCRNSSRSGWASPLFLSLNGGSIGLQAGVQSSDIVLYMTGDSARTSLENGNFTLSGSLSAVAGTFDKSFAPPSTGGSGIYSNERRLCRRFNKRGKYLP